MHNWYIILMSIKVYFQVSTARNTMKCVAHEDLIVALWTMLVPMWFRLENQVISSQKVQRVEKPVQYRQQVWNTAMNSPHKKVLNKQLAAAEDTITNFRQWPAPTQILMKDWSSALVCILLRNSKRKILAGEPLSMRRTDFWCHRHPPFNFV